MTACYSGLRRRLSARFRTRLSPAQLNRKHPRGDRVCELLAKLPKSVYSGANSTASVMLMDSSFWRQLGPKKNLTSCPGVVDHYKTIDPNSLNVDFKKQVQARKALFPQNAQETEKPKVKVTPCPICGVKIASHILKKHQSEYHPPGPKPKKNMHLPPQPKAPIKKSTCPDLPLQSVPNCELANKSGVPESLCPRCGGDGGVRGGCRKCDGTGWVPKEMERDVVYRPDQHASENSRISNSDYLGGNDGAHFREMDGRIGSIPLFDDYGEES